MTIEWSASYLVGDEKIDTQHQQLFALANEVFAAQTQSALRLCFIHLYKYVREHFADEEALMLEVDFPDYRQHADLHDALLARLNALSVKIGRSEWSLHEVHAFMEHWLLSHILQEDIRLVQYVNQGAARN
jgi:hemerythrin